MSDQCRPVVDLAHLDELLHGLADGQQQLLPVGPLAPADPVLHQAVLLVQPAALPVHQLLVLVKVHLPGVQRGQVQLLRLLVQPDPAVGLGLPCDAPEEGHHGIKLHSVTLEHDQVSNPPILSHRGLL